MSSRPFPHLYGTNQIPTQSELQALKDILAPDEAALVELEKEREQLLEALDKIKEKTTAINKRIRPTKALVSLLRRLPTEIMQSIFERSISASPQYNTINICDPPLLLLRVCRSWREIALNTPRLWNHISLTIPTQLKQTSDVRKLTLFRDEVGRWLSRSKGLPLALSARKSMENDSSAAKDALRDIIKDVIKESERWDGLDLELTDVISEFGGLFPEDQRRPQLKSLTLTGYRWWGQELSIVQSLALLAKAPTLTKLKLWTNDSALYRILDFPVVWSNLTFLVLGNDHIAHYISESPGAGPSLTISYAKILEKCVNLRHCYLTLPTWPPPASWTPPGAEVQDETPTQQIKLAKLEALYLAGCCKQMDTLLFLLETPSIQELHYLPHYEVSAHVSKSFLGAIEFYGAQLKVLSFDLPNITPDAFQTVLQGIPNIKQLSIGPHTADGSSLSSHFTSYKHPLPDPPLVLTDAHLALFTPKPNEEKHPYPHLEVLRCNLRSTVTPDAVLAFLNGMGPHEPLFDPYSRSLKPATTVKKTTPSAATTTTPRRSGRKFRELSMDQLPLDFPLANYPFHFNPWGSEVEEVLKPFKEAGIELSFSQSRHYKPTPYYSGIGLAHRFNYATYFGND